MAKGALTVIPVPDLPMVKPGDNLVEIVCTGMENAGISLEDGDVLVLAQKIVSKADGCFISMTDMEPSGQALKIAEETGKEPQFVEMVLRQSNDVVRTGPNVLIVEHLSGMVMANAGIDRSNIDRGARDDQALLLPDDSDASARALRDAIVEKTGKTIALIIADSVGRAWRYGTSALAIGCAGIEPLDDQRGDVDMFGHTLEVTEIALADQVAAAANLVMGEATEAIPAAIVRGLEYPRSERPVSVLFRPKNEDLFR
jgi:coenzyme F420-0:L-glutamate ligase / coenzyme F420-1:gamma-L-glutamate ligase